MLDREISIAFIFLSSMFLSSKKTAGFPPRSGQLFG